jgi:DNA topoisomerase-1
MTPLSTEDLTKQLKEEHLSYITDQTPGFFRQKNGKNFAYYDLDGKKIKDEKTIERINRLAIPPAWDQVWISPKANGYLQATGLDAKKRKQYIYHPDWVTISQQNKFAKMVDFGLSLPKIRSRVRYNLQKTDLSKEKILATVIWLLEHTFIRIGNEEYSKENNSYGLTTLRNKHVDIDGTEVTFSFKGKSGVIHELEVNNPTIAKTIKKCIELPGYEIFKYIDDDGNRHVVDSSDVNLFLKDTTEDEFTAKDFRTWGGTSLSALDFYKVGHAEDTKMLKKNIKQTVKKVSQHLGNTVSVCQNYYIHPTVIQTYETNILVPHFARYAGHKVSDGLAWDEQALIKLLQKYS